MGVSSIIANVIWYRAMTYTKTMKSSFYIFVLLAGLISLSIITIPAILFEMPTWYLQFSIDFCNSLEKINNRL